MIATPLGEGGRGGIDRIVDGLRREIGEVRPAGVEVTFATTRGQGHIVWSIFYLAAAIVRLIMRRLAGQADVLHVNLSSHGSTIRKVILCRVARILGVPYVIHLHGSRFRQFWLARTAWSGNRIAGMFRGAKRILVLGQVWKSFVIQQMPDMADRIEVLPNASRAPGRAPLDRQGPATILFLGQVGDRKGVPQLLQAFDLLRDLGGWRGMIAGDGKVTETRSEIARLGLQDRVTLTGWVGPADVERFLAESQILVLPSFDENLPMSIVEGMGYGLAIVATPVGAIEDIIRNEDTGLIVKAGDPVQLADALGRLVSDPLLRRRLGNQARAFHQEHLEMGCYLNRLIDVWRRAAAPRLLSPTPDAVRTSGE